MGAESSSLAVYGDELDQAFAKEVEPEESTVQFVKCVSCVAPLAARDLRLLAAVQDCSVFVVVFFPRSFLFD